MIERKVPCDGCTLCCHFYNVMLDEAAGDDLASYHTTRQPDGTIILARRADGACVYLGERGCTIHDRRPAECRAYDCRVVYSECSEQARAQWVEGGTITQAIFDAAEQRLGK